MEIPLQITFRNMAPSETIEKRIRKKVARVILQSPAELQGHRRGATSSRSQGKVLRGTHRSYRTRRRVSDQEYAKPLGNNKNNSF
jgi:hypothetical protein